VDPSQKSNPVPARAPVRAPAPAPADAASARLVEERKLLVIAVREARALARHGDREAAWEYLCESADRARRHAEAGEPWALALVPEWQAALATFRADY
jgi:hypothetical protein